MSHLDDLGLGILHGEPPQAPWHLVNDDLGRHIGPFSTASDAAMARHIGGGGWNTARILDTGAFEQHLRGNPR